MKAATSLVLTTLLLGRVGKRSRSRNWTIDRICLTPPEPKQGDWTGCIHRWASKLAGAAESSRVVATAAATACADAVAWQVNNAPAEERQALLADINRSITDIAMYRVIQARAGRCAIP